MSQPPDHPLDTSRAAGGEPDENGIAELFDEAGPRREPPPADLEAALSAARFAWERKVRERARRGDATGGSAPGPRARRATATRIAIAAAALAAALLLAVGLRFALVDGGDPPAPVARVVVALGSLELRDGEAWVPLGAGRELAAGAVVRTTGEARAALRTAPGASLRLDRGTRVRLVSVERVELDRGALYVDTGPAEGLVIATAILEARDVGTRFAVRVDQESVRVAVRDGAVVVERGEDRFRAERGDALRVTAAGEPERSAVPAWGEAWSWTLDVAPPFELEGATLAEFLAWVEAETGWTVRYDRTAVGEPAEGIVLHGSLAGVGPVEALDLVLPGVEVTYRLEDGVLTVE